jgi:DNA repair exonuclease SbcCD ATPase subunit
MLHDIQRQLNEQAHEMERQYQEISELRQALERAEPSLAKSEEEKEIWRRRSEAYRKQLSRRNRRDGSETDHTLSIYTEGQA